MLPPLSLYIHVPWCVRKCPYCDFNSHEVDSDEQNTVGSSVVPDALAERYLEALLADWKTELRRLNDFGGARPLRSIFIGGGTPSLLSPFIYKRLLQQIRSDLECVVDMEVTLEANPGAVDTANFSGYREAGINRISLGVQSFRGEQLKALGRVHSSDQAKAAIAAVQQAGFSRFNVDLMFGLPGQTQAQALADLQTAIDSGASHVSWYQLTLEPNTEFFSFPPDLPDDDDIADTQLAGQRLLAATGLRQYEISAYARDGEASRHNLNYWRFGDYLAIGAGAHGKLSDPAAGNVLRYRKTRQPDAYLARHEGARHEDARHQQNIVTTATGNDAFIAHEELVPESGLVFEFMLNALRLTEGVGESTFIERTGLDSPALQPELAILQQRGLMSDEAGRLCATELGSRFLNDVLARFAG